MSLNLNARANEMLTSLLATQDAPEVPMSRLQDYLLALQVGTCTDPVALVADAAALGYLIAHLYPDA